MVVVELELVHGGNHHERAMELNGMLARVREGEVELRGCAHHVKGELQLQQLTSGELEDGDQLGAPWELREEDEAGGLSFSNSGEVESDMVELVAGMLQQGRPPSSSSSPSLPLFSLLLLSLFSWFLLLMSMRNGEGERDGWLFW